MRIFTRACSRWRVCLTVAAGLFCIVAAQAATLPDQRLAFDHLTTGFALSGQHQFVICEDCHVGGVFKGTPKQCTGCHNDVIARGKPVNHLPTSAPCDSCHRATVAFGIRAVMNHSTTTSPCASCHNGISTHGKDPMHMPTTNRCEVCHVTNLWKPVPSTKVSHFDVTGSCAGCHNGTTPGVNTFKSPTHITSSNRCDNCHDTPPSGAGWRVIIVDHSQVSMSCVSCHVSGVPYVATFRLPSHILTTNNCIACHASGPPGRWTPALRVDHNEFVGNPSCNSCHDGVRAPGQGMGHFVTAAVCSACHTVKAWAPVIYTHAAGTRYKAHTFDTCANCHAPAPGTAVAKKPWPQYSVCASCHADDHVTGHGGTTATARDNCGLCHNTSVWK